METFSALLALCAGNSPVPCEFPTQRPVTRSFDVFFDLRLNKQLSKQPWGWWFETPSWSLRRHCNEYTIWYYSMFYNRSIYINKLYVLGTTILFALMCALIKGWQLAINLRTIVRPKREKITPKWFIYFSSISLNSFFVLWVYVFNCTYN